MRVPVGTAALNRKIPAAVVVVSLLIAVYVIAFTSIGRAAGTCPLVHWDLGYPSQGKIPFKIFAAGDQSRRYLGSGTIAWCLYGNFGLLARSYLTNRILGGVAASSDGQYLATAGFQIAPGPAGIYVNGAVYLFDGNGQIRWNVSTSDPIFSVHINSNGSVIVANSPGLLYLNNAGKVLWNYSEYEATTVAIVNDGLNVVAGISQIPYPNRLNFGSALVMFDAHGNPLWNFTILDQIFDSTASLDVSNGHIASGVSATGYNGTLLYHDLKGNLIWSRQVNSAILMVNFDSVGTAICVETNWGQVKFDLTGKVISNQTSPFEPGGFPC